MLSLIGFLLGVAIIFASPFIFAGVVAVSIMVGAIWGFYRGIFFIIQAFITDVLGIGNL